MAASVSSEILVMNSKMQPSAKPMLGVLGGMGPMATADFMAKIVRNTSAEQDQGHVPLVVLSDPTIPDRTEAILDGRQSPLPAMIECVSLLEMVGVTAIAIPCNTAHFWYDDLQAETELPILHIVDAVVGQLRAKGLMRSPIGLLATTGTIVSEVYSRRLAVAGLEVIVPGDYEQRELMTEIRQVKAGLRCGRAKVEHIAGNLRSRGAKAIIAACTELPLLLQDNSPDIVDATEALALACICHFHKDPKVVVL